MLQRRARSSVKDEQPGRLVLTSVKFAPHLAAHFSMLMSLALRPWAPAATAFGGMMKFCLERRCLLARDRRTSEHELRNLARWDLR